MEVTKQVRVSYEHMAEIFRYRAAAENGLIMAPTFSEFLEVNRPRVQLYEDMRHFSEWEGRVTNWQRKGFSQHAAETVAAFQVDGGAA